MPTVPPAKVRYVAISSAGHHKSRLHSYTVIPMVCGGVIYPRRWNTNIPCSWIYEFKFENLHDFYNFPGSIEVGNRWCYQGREGLDDIKACRGDVLSKGTCFWQGRAARFEFVKCSAGIVPEKSWNQRHDRHQLRETRQVRSPVLQLGTIGWWMLGWDWMHWMILNASALII